MSTAAEAAPPAAHDLSLTRLIDASPELCFKAWTEHLPEWWGPHGMTTPVCEMDLRSGGIMRTVMRAPDGREFSNQGVFLEVTAPSRIVITDAFAPGWKPAGKPFMTAITTFEPEGGKTRYTARALHWSEEDRKTHEAMGFHDGWGQSADRFEAVVARLKAELATKRTGPTRDVVLRRSIDAPRAAVWDAWTSPARLAAWWGPNQFTNPVCEADARPGGALFIVMRAPDGTDYPMRGAFDEVAEGERLVFTSRALGDGDRPLLEARTVVTLAEAGGKTELTVEAHAEGLAPESPRMLAGMQEGWSQSLDKLAALMAQARS